MPDTELVIVLSEPGCGLAEVAGALHAGVPELVVLADLEVLAKNLHAGSSRCTASKGAGDGGGNHFYSSVVWLMVSSVLALPADQRALTPLVSTCLDFSDAVVVHPVAEAFGFILSVVADADTEVIDVKVLRVDTRWQGDGASPSHADFDFNLTVKGDA